MTRLAERPNQDGRAQRGLGQFRHWPGSAPGAITSSLLGAGGAVRRVASWQRQQILQTFTSIKMEMSSTGISARALNQSNWTLARPPAAATQSPTRQLPLPPSRRALSIDAEIAQQPSVKMITDDLQVGSATLEPPLASG
jgi:hypothetical protein